MDSEQQRRDPHTSRAQRARGRCAYARTGWSAKFVMDGLVTSAGDASLNLPHFRYHPNVAPCWLRWCLKKVRLEPHEGIQEISEELTTLPKDSRSP